MGLGVNQSDDSPIDGSCSAIGVLILLWCRSLPELAAGPCSEPTGRAFPRAKALLHILLDAAVEHRDEKRRRRRIVGADRRPAAFVASRDGLPLHAPNEVYESVFASHGFSFHFGFRSSTSQIRCSRLLRVCSLFTGVSAKAVIS
jgi:hypothetical protein